MKSNKQEQSEQHEDGVCWLEHMRPIVDFADVGAAALHLTRAEALQVLQIAWLQRLVEEFCEEPFEGDDGEAVAGEEWKRPS